MIRIAKALSQFEEIEAAYLFGSSLSRKDFEDIDLAILPSEAFLVEHLREPDEALTNWKLNLDKVYAGLQRGLPTPQNFRKVVGVIFPKTSDASQGSPPQGEEKR